MASSLSTAITLGGESKYSNTSLYPRLNECNYHHSSDCHRDSRTKSLWRRIKQLDWNQYHSYFRHFWGYNSLRRCIQHNYSRGRLSTRNSNQSSGFINWFGTVRNNRHRQINNNKRYFGILIGLLSVGCTPAYAEGNETYNTAAPESTATGNVTNQAVQFQNNGAPSRQQMGGYNGRGIACNGPTMTFSPFWLASENKPYDPESYSRGWNYGAQINFMVPMDSSITEMCKSLARRQNEKMRIDYELVRSLKCAELMKKGFTFRPGSRVEHMCSDIVPIVSLLKTTTPETK